MKAIKQFVFKLIIILCVISTFSCFVASTPVNADSKVKKDEFYYSGTMNGSYTVDKGFMQKLIDSLDTILDYLLGIMTMGTRIVFVGWTELLEKILTWIIEGASGVEVNVEGVEATGAFDHDDYITFESIVFNHVYLFNINVFDFEINNDYDSLGKDLVHDEYGNEIPEEFRKKSDISEDSLIIILKQAIAGWYYSFRLISIMIMLILLIYIGIKLAVASATKEKAFYKQVLFDWLVGFIIIFSIHYVILAMITFNEMLVTEIQKMDSRYKNMKVYEYGLIERADTGVTSTDMELTMYDEVRTRAYDAKLTVGTVGMIMYMVLVYYAWKFSFIYLKRYLVVAVLIMMAPFVAATYAYNKIRSGKAVIFVNWLKELFFMIILQSIHALLYVIFMESALAISLSSIGGMLFSFVLLHYMTKSEEIFRKIFNVQGNLTNDVSGSKLKDIGNVVKNIGMGTVGKKAAMATTKFAGRVVSKPYRALAGAGFSKAMELRANRNLEKDEQIKKENEAIMKRNEEREKIIKNGGKTDNFESLKLTSEDKKKLDEAKEIERQRKLILGSLAKNLPDDIKDLTEEQKKEIEDYKKLTSAKNMSQQDFIKDLYDNRGKYAEEYDKLTAPKAVLAHEFKTRWNKMMEPTQYLVREKIANNNNNKNNNTSNKKDDNNEKQDNNENNNNQDRYTYKRKKTEREHENWGPLLKYFSKKKSGVSYRFNSEYMNTDFLFGLDSKQRSVIKAYFNGGVKEELAGFSGILLGLPLVVAEPGLGFGFLAKGIGSTIKAKNTVFGTSAKRKNLRNKYMSADGKYHLVGYDGKSIETIANGVQAAARENAEDVARGRVEYNKQVIRRTKKHKKLYSALTGALKVEVGFGATAAALGTVATLSATPAMLVVGTAAVGTVLTGTIIGSLKSSAYVGLHDIIKTARKQSQKDWEEELKSTDNLLKFMADRYYEVEEEKNSFIIQKAEHDIEESNLEFEKAYRVAVESIIESVDNMDDEELLLETEYDDEVEVETKQDGTQKLTVASEKQVIDKAIIEIIQKRGIIKLDEYDLDDERNLDLIKDNITDRLVEKGVITKGQKADDIIEHLGDKIKNQKADLESTDPEAVEDKLLYDSYIGVMKKKKIKDPNKVKAEDVEKEFVKRLKKLPNNPTPETNKVVEGLQKQKEDDNKTNQKSTNSEEIIAQVQENTRKIETDTVIQRAKDNIPELRKTISEKAREKLNTQNKLDNETREKIKETLTKKKIRKIDKKVVNTQRELKEGTFKPFEMDSVSNPDSNQVSFYDTFSSEQSDMPEDINSKMIRSLETSAVLAKIKKDKTNAETILRSIQKNKFDAENKLKSYLPPQNGKERLQAYKSEIFDKDGTVRLDKFLDGSIRANSSKDGSSRVNSLKDGSVRANALKYGSTKVENKQKSEPTLTELSVLEIMRRVKSEKNI